MKGVFRYDSPVMRFFSRIADLMILNVIVLVCMLPLITIGASLTAMHSVLLSMVQNRESHIVRSYWKAFRENFKQSTILWLVMAVLGIALRVDMRICRDASGLLSVVLQIVLGAVAIFWYMAFLYLFPLRAKFENRKRETLKNALLMSIAAFPRTLCMLAASAIPFLLLWYIDMRCLPLLLLLGASGPGYLNALLYSPYFDQLDPEKKCKEAQISCKLRF